eukprot:GHVO01011515.1.p1 GENE.GHVO01011515.1~~GHVO01011515.1.p1  ORF type:complete len:324 (+),score=35.73 GHVO01011515.1:64-1035(+)
MGIVLVMRFVILHTDMRFLISRLYGTPIYDADLRSLKIIIPVKDPENLRVEFVFPRPQNTIFVGCGRLQDKPTAFKKELESGNYTDHDLVLLADDDIYFNPWPERRVIDLFESYNTEVMLSQEGDLSPHPKWLERNWKGDEYGDDVYVNSGFAMGMPSHLLKMLQVLIEYDGDDQEAMSAWYTSLSSNYSAARIDRSQRLAKVLQVPYVYTEEFEGSPVPWYNSTRRTIWKQERDCNNLLEVDGCVVRQRLVARPGVHITREQNEAAITRGPYSVGQQQFQPEMESFAYHGNGRSKDMFKKLVKIVNASCTENHYRRIQEYSF